LEIAVSKDEDWLAAARKWTKFWRTIQQNHRMSSDIERPFSYSYQRRVTNNGLPLSGPQWLHDNLQVFSRTP
jgi:hypothetical protein